jgi:hypothetical protein
VPSGAELPAEKPSTEMAISRGLPCNPVVGRAVDINGVIWGAWELLRSLGVSRLSACLSGIRSGIVRSYAKVHPITDSELRVHQHGPHNSGRNRPNSGLQPFPNYVEIGFLMLGTG